MFTKIKERHSFAWKEKGNETRPGLDSPQITLKVTNFDQKQDNALTRKTEKDRVDAPLPLPPVFSPSLLPCWVCCGASRVERASADQPSFFLCLLLLGHHTCIRTHTTQTRTHPGRTHTSPCGQCCHQGEG